MPLSILMGRRTTRNKSEDLPDVEYLELSGERRHETGYYYKKT